MRSWIVGVGSGVVCATLGFAIAYGLAPQPAPAPRHECKATPRIRAQLVFRRPTPEASPAVCECEGEHLAATLCRGQLDACRQARQSVRQGWPEDAASESPEQWSRTIDEALAECELGADLEFIECSEYPCAAALRPRAAADSEKAHGMEMNRLMEAARSCAPLQQAYGFAEADHETIDVYRLDAGCGEQRENFFVMVALDRGGPAWKLLKTKKRTATQERDLNRWIYRRADDIAAKWPCDAQAG